MKTRKTTPTDGITPRQQEKEMKSSQCILLQFETWAESPDVVIILSGPNENLAYYLIRMKTSILSGPNENSQKASMSVNVLAAYSQEGVFE